MKKIVIDGQEHCFEAGMTIMQACETVGIEIPRFCYHEKLAIAGNCRMCLVEVEKAPKPVASCSIAITDGMIIKTQTDLVKKAREGIMEFLLINHPLDCPICDQGGECDLQDQAVKYGSCKSHYQEDKRAVLSKDFGPLIATNMTRCIHCTRCVRFLEDIAGTHELGGIGRGEEMEISTYIERGITSELSGNIIDLCPVGALTSKPYAFTARSWELTHHYSIDIMDSLGSHVRLDTKNDQIMRILPQAFDPINEEWLSDRARFSYDGLKYQRLVAPLKAKGSSFVRISYNEAIENLANLITQSENPLFLGGALTDCETYFAFKNLTEKLGKGICDQEEALQPFVDSSNYLCHSTIAGFEDFDSLLIIGSNPRWEVPLLNARIRKAFLQKNMKIALLNGDDKIDLNYPYQQLMGDPSQVLWDLWRGRHPYVQTLQESKKPAILIGARLAAEFLDLIEALAHKYGVIKDNWRGLNILHPTVGALNALESNFIATDRSYQADLTIALGADEANVEGPLVYLGHHGDRQVYNSSLIIATPAHPEKASSHVNLEGRAQRSEKAVNPLEEARPEYQIALDLADILEVKLDFWDVESLHNMMAEKNNIFMRDNLFNLQPRDKVYQPQIPQKPHKVAYQPFYDSGYLTNAITRSSLMLQKCHELLEKC